MRERDNLTRDPENRIIDERSQHEIQETMLDKTLPTPFLPVFLPSSNPIRRRFVEPKRRVA